MDKVTELKADAKVVYGDSDTAILALADKYNVTTQRIDFHRQGVVSGPALASKSDRKEIQSKLYATIKGQLRDLGAN